MVCKEELLSIDQVYIVRAKIEANTDRYTFILKQSIQTNKEKMKKKLNKI
jgi:hypothetical protein